MCRLPHQCVCHIVAMRGEDRGIGYKNQLLYRVKADMKHFRQTTTGHIVLMGRKTHESVGRCLPNRINVVLTRNLLYKPLSPYVVVFHDVLGALEWCRTVHPDKTVFVVGGEGIYEATLPHVCSVNASVILDGARGTPADSYYPHLPEHFFLMQMDPQMTSLDLVSKRNLTFYVCEYERQKT